MMHIMGRQSKRKDVRSVTRRVRRLKRRVRYVRETGEKFIMLVLLEKAHLPIVILRWYLHV
jgi:hypothetical protein